MKSAINRHLWISILIAGCIPLYQNILSVLIVLLAVNALFSKELRVNKFNFLWIILPPVLFFGAHLIGVIWSENQSFAWFDVQIKLSFLLFPVLFAVTRPFVKTQFEKIYLVI